MAHTSYSEKLQNPLWQKKRLHILNRDNFTCTLCGDKETTLHIHHKSYIRGKQPWEYNDDNLQTLCKHCHAVIEFFKKKSEDVIYINKESYEIDYQRFDIVTNCPIFGGRYCYNMCMNGDEITIHHRVNDVIISCFSKLLERTEHLKYESPF